MKTLENIDLFKIEIKWLPVEDIEDNLLFYNRKSLAEIKIIVNGINITESENGEVRDHICVSAYPIACLFVGKWFELLYEDFPYITLNDAGEGYLYPDLTFGGDTESLLLYSRAGQVGHIKFLNSLPETRVGRDLFKSEMLKFIKQTSERTNSNYLKRSLGNM